MLKSGRSPNDRSFGQPPKKIKIFSYNKMRYDINDSELQNMVDNIKKRLIETYKDEIEGIDDHFINTLTQNFILQLDQENIDLDKLMDQHNILLDK